MLLADVADMLLCCGHQSAFSLVGFVFTLSSLPLCGNQQHPHLGEPDLLGTIA